MSDISSLREVVPQLFYDIIGRLVPGMVVILSFVIVYVWPTYTCNSIGPLLSGQILSFGFWTFLFLAMVSYVVSILLFGLWNVIETFLRNSPTAVNNGEDDPKQPSRSFMYDAIRLKSPDAGARLVKLRAEIHLSQVLLAGWIILAVVNLYLIIRDMSAERAFLEGVLILSILGAYSFMRYIESRFITNLENHWRILCCDTIENYDVSRNCIEAT